MKQFNNDFPLVDTSLEPNEILACINTILSGNLSMGLKVYEFEQKFAEYCKVPYAVMVNSGSSANLLAISALTNPLRSRQLKPGDKVGVPAVCWSTSMWPIIQNGLIPVLIDVDYKTLNLCIKSLKKVLTNTNIKALMLVHILGNSTEMNEIIEISKKNDIILIEDTCESLGSTFKNNLLGTIGDFGTFSFYYSHHLTTIEGGMVITSNKDDYDLLKCLRAHGWSRDLSNRNEIENENINIDSRFLFVNIGYNLRPMEIQGALGLEQLKKLEFMNSSRIKNVDNIKKTFIKHKSWRNQLIFPKETKNIKSCWFGFPFLLSSEVNISLNDFKLKLKKLNIETRPIVSGNMALQPVMKNFNIDLTNGPFTGAQLVHDRGIFIGCHTKLLNNNQIDNLVNNIMNAIIE